MLALRHYPYCSFPHLGEHLSILACTHLLKESCLRQSRGGSLLTERTRRTQSRTRHVQANELGKLVCLDTFYIGKLKGVGKPWQITACDAASSCALAKVAAVCNATEAAVFLSRWSRQR